MLAVKKKKKKIQAEGTLEKVMWRATTLVRVRVHDGQDDSTVF